MKKNINDIIVIALLALASFAGASCANTASSKVVDEPRDLEYEHYCDSIWDNNPDYYLDVLRTTDKYQDYINKHGYWWDY